MNVEARYYQAFTLLSRLVHTPTAENRKAADEWLADQIEWWTDRRRLEKAASEAHTKELLGESR